MLRCRSVPVTLVAREAHVGAPALSENAAQHIESRMIADGVNIIHNRQVTAYRSSDNSLLDGVELDDGRTVPTHTVITTIGTYGTTEWLDGSEIGIDEETGLIRVDNHLQTNIPDIFAAGTVAQFPDGSAARTWAESAEQGRIAALNMLGEATICTSPIYLVDPNSMIYDVPFGELVNLKV
jgi:pyruvate/2-oxoglutarate dehydrogenase complex dihydrolipoamide dehydrogenase (E3) component